MAVISVMLGVPREDQDELRSWSDAMLHREEGSAELTPAGIDGATRLYGYFNDVITNRRRTRVKIWWARSSRPRRATGCSPPPRCSGFCFLLLIAGNETTTKLLGNAVYWLARIPGPARPGARGPDLIPAAVEETLRFDTSTQALARVLTRDVELHGVTLPRGAQGPAAVRLRRTATSAAGTSPTASTSTATRRAISRSATASTTASARRSPGSRRGSRSRCCCPLLGEYAVDVDRLRSACTRATSAASPGSRSRLPGMTRKHHVRIGKDPERLNRAFWDDDADDYQAEHGSQLDVDDDGLGRLGPPRVRAAACSATSPASTCSSTAAARRSGRSSSPAPGARVTGLDQSRGQLRHAAEKVAAAGVAVQLVCASATAVPLRDASFDVVFCDHGAMSFCDPYRTVPEVARLLRPGGLLRVQHLDAAAEPLLPAGRPRCADHPEAPRQVVRRPRVRLGRRHDRLPDPARRVDPPVPRPRSRRRGPARAAPAEARHEHLRRLRRPQLGPPLAGRGDLEGAEA